jgi:hypothetical protein
MDLLITIFAYALALVASAVGNIVGFWLFLPLTYFAARLENTEAELHARGALTEKRRAQLRRWEFLLRILRQFLGSFAAFPLSLAAACLVLSLFGVGHGWLIFILVAVLAFRDVLGATVFPLSQQAGTAASIVFTGIVYFAYYLSS